MTGFGLEVEDLTKTFGGNDVVRGSSFRLASGDILGLVGPSGCGKTTTLRMIAGLETPSSGRILIGGREVSGDGISLSPDKRDIGMVFQSYALWPHMTVFDNVALPLKLKKQKREEIRARVEEVLGLVGLSGLGARYPGQLSGGQQQRVAVARSLAARPQLLLLDEPLSNLDARLRDQVRVELRDLLKSLSITAVFVTHDQVEAMTLCDQIAVMRDGEIVQFGTPADVYERPTHRFVAEFMGKANIVDAVVEGEVAPGRWSVRTLAGDRPMVVSATDVLEAEEPVAIVARPEAFRTEGGAGRNHLRGSVVKSVYIGNISEWTVLVDGVEIRVALPVGEDLGAPGSIVDIYLPEAAAVSIPRSAGIRAESAD